MTTRRSAVVLIVVAVVAFEGAATTLHPGSEQPESLIEATTKHPAEAIGPGTAALVLVGNDVRLAQHWRFDRYSGFVTIHNQSWVAALLPDPGPYLELAWIDSFTRVTR